MARLASRPGGAALVALGLVAGAPGTTACSFVSDFDHLTDEPASSGSAAGGAGGAGGGGNSGAGGSTCGDGDVEAGEECDDGGAVEGDGCDASCAIECQPSPEIHFEATTKHCYRFPFNELSWEAAASECSVWSGYLVSVTSAAEEDFLKSVLATKPATGAWIGASDSDTEGDFVWASGEPWGFENWGPNAPMDPGGTKDCVFHGPPGQFNWTDYDCVGMNPYVCERATGVD